MPKFNRHENEPSVMTKVPKIEPHIPFYAANGNKVVQEWTEPFVDRVGNKATITRVIYKDKKGKEHEATIRVQWHDVDAMFAYTKNLYK